MKAAAGDVLIGTGNASCPLEFVSLRRVLQRREASHEFPFGSRSQNYISGRRVIDYAVVKAIVNADYCVRTLFGIDYLFAFGDRLKSKFIPVSVHSRSDRNIYYVTSSEIQVSNVLTHVMRYYDLVFILRQPSAADVDGDHVIKLFGYGCHEEILTVHLTGTCVNYTDRVPAYDIRDFLVCFELCEFFLIHVGKVNFPASAVGFFIPDHVLNAAVCPFYYGG